MFPVSSEKDGGRTREEEEEKEEDEEEQLDPRVQEELEKLNTCTEEINQLEIDLEDANCLFQTLLSDSTHQLNSLAKKLGNCIEKVRERAELNRNDIFLPSLARYFGRKW